MRRDEIDACLAGLSPRRAVVVSERYPPDAAGGAEISLHLLLREPAIRDEVLVVTFDKAAPKPLRRTYQGVEVLALPSPAAWPLHRLSQVEVDALKTRPYGLKWASYWAQSAACFARDPAAHGPALAVRFSGDPAGGLRMDHKTTAESAVPAALQAIVERLKPEIVHADNARAIMTAADALGGSATPFVALVRDHRFTSRRFDQSLSDRAADGWRARFAARCAEAALAFRKDCLRRAAVVVATSDHLAATLHGVVAPERLRRIPLVPAELPAEAGERPEEGGFRILLVGSLTPNKGQAHLVEAWPEIAAAIPGASLDIAGRGPDEAAIRRLVASAGAGDRIRLHGHVEGEALAALYRACDALAVPTLWPEPFGRTPLEAGAHGRPVVAYAAGGLAETIEDGVTGVLVPQGDREAFVAALARLAADPAARARMGAAGRELVASRYAPTRLAAELRALWDEVAAASRTLSPGDRSPA